MGDFKSDDNDCVSNFIPHFIMDVNCLSMMGLKIISDIQLTLDSSAARFCKENTNFNNEKAKQ